MKKIMMFLFLMPLLLSAQTKTVTMGSGGIGSDAYQDTLKTGKTTQTININQSIPFKNWILTVFTTSGADTITVETKSRKGSFYSYKSVVDLTTSLIQTGSIITTTTKKEYAINDPEIIAVKLVTSDGSANTVFVLSGKNNGNIMGTSGNLTVTAVADPTTFGTPKTTLEGMFSAMSYPTELIGLTDTVTTRVDTTIISGHDSYIKGTIKADDSVEVSIVGSFPSGKTWIITETTPLEISWAINQNYNKLFVRRYGSAGTPRFYLRLSAY